TRCVGFLSRKEMDAPGSKASPEHDITDRLSSSGKPCKWCIRRIHKTLLFIVKPAHCVIFLILAFSSLGHTAPYAAVVMDAATGKILEAENAHKTRFPASLTKKMTLYLIFDALASGRLKPTSRLYVSAYAASQPPSKLGLKAGERVPLETIIMGL